MFLDLKKRLLQHTCWMVGTHLQHKIHFPTTKYRVQLKFNKEKTVSKLNSHENFESGHYDCQILGPKFV
jgi:hypothetical protein